MWRDLEDITEVEMMLAGPPGTGITEAEKTEIDTRLTTLEGHTLSDLLDGEPADLQVPVYKAATDTWEPGQQTNGIPRIANSGLEVNTGVGTLDFSGAFAVSVPSEFPTWAVVAPNFGTGAGAVAEGSHTHPLPVSQRYTLASPGSVPTISSGERDLISQSVGSFTEGVPTLVEVEGFVFAEGVDDPARCHLYIEIDGTRYSSSAVPYTEPFTWEWGVNAQVWWKASATITRASGGSATRNVTFGVQWVEWGGLSVKSAAMWVKRTAYRS